MPADVAHLCAVLAVEHDSLDDVVAGLGDAGWTTPTPAPGWDVHDQVSHLAHFDDASVLALTDPGAFIEQRRAALADIDGFTAAVAAQHRALDHGALLAWWRTARRRLLDAVAAAAAADPAARLPWYGPDLSLASAVTARIMETWAHGQDVRDALGVDQPAPEATLREVAHLGVRTLPNSFLARGRSVPDAPIRVELVSPSGAGWVWGPADAVDVVRGSALGFCLVVTQRRHPAATDLVADGAVAREWLGLAQAFAGPPGAGRPAPGGAA